MFRVRDSEWQRVERALELVDERPSEFVRIAALERAGRILAEART